MFYRLYQRNKISKTPLLQTQLKFLAKKEWREPKSPDGVVFLLLLFRYLLTELASFSSHSLLITTWLYHLKLEENEDMHSRRGAIRWEIGDQQRWDLEPHAPCLERNLLHPWMFGCLCLAWINTLSIGTDLIIYICPLTALNYVFYLYLASTYHFSILFKK